MLYEAILIGYGILAIVMAYLSFSLEKQHQLLKTIFLAFAVSSIVVIPYMITKIIEIEKYTVTNPDLASYYQNILDVSNSIFLVGIGIFALFLFYISYIMIMLVVKFGLQGIGIHIGNDDED